MRKKMYQTRIIFRKFLQAREKLNICKVKFHIQTEVLKTYFPSSGQY